MLANDLVRNRAARERHLHHLATRAVHGLADRFGHFVRLPRRETDFPLTVADGHERVEREAASALHDLRDAVDGHDVLDQVIALSLAAALTATTAITTAPATAVTAATAAWTATATTAAATRAAASTTAATTGAATSTTATRAA